VVPCSVNHVVDVVLFVCPRALSTHLHRIFVLVLFYSILFYSIRFDSIRFEPIVTVIKTNYCSTSLAQCLVYHPNTSHLTATSLTARHYSICILSLSLLCVGCACRHELGHRSTLATLHRVPSESDTRSTHIGSRVVSADTVPAMAQVQALPSGHHPPLLGGALHYDSGTVALLAVDVMVACPRC
jgi:hypothetical protein